MDNATRGVNDSYSHEMPLSVHTQTRQSTALGNATKCTNGCCLGSVVLFGGTHERQNTIRPDDRAIRRRGFLALKRRLVRAKRLANAMSE